MRREPLLMLLLLLAFGYGHASLAGNEIVVGYTADAESMDPGAHRSRTTETILRNIYDGLVTRSDDMVLRPQLAVSWRQLDGLHYEFRLREGVRFHDGTTLTAEDVVFTFRRLIERGAIDGSSSPRRALLGTLQRIDMVDDHTVRFALSEPWPVFPEMLPFQEIVSQAFLQSAVSERGGVGTGPFKLKHWLRGRAVVLERFDDYYGGSPARPPVGLACVDRVTFRIVPHSPSRVAGLLAGDFHIIDSVPSDAVQVIEGHPDLRILSVDGTRSYFLALNLRAPPFTDRRVRRALAHAIDREAIIESRYLGQATVIDGILGPDAFGKNEQLPRYEPDVAAASALLNAAGYPNGFSVLLHALPELGKTADAIAHQLAAVGLDVKVRLLDRSATRRIWLRDGPPEAAMLLTSWGNASLDPVGIFSPTHRSGGRGNSAGYSNSDLDELLDTAAVELDRAARAELYRRAEAIVNRDLPYVYLWVQKDIYGISKRVTGWQARPDGRISLHDACLK